MRGWARGSDIFLERQGWFGVSYFNAGMPQGGIVSQKNMNASATNEQRANPQAAASVIMGLPAEPVRVLLVEDDPRDVRLLQELLAELPNPFRLEDVDCLAAALDRIAQGGIDLIICDLALPDSEGIATFHRLQAAA